MLDTDYNRLLVVDPSVSVSVKVTRTNRLGPVMGHCWTGARADSSFSGGAGPSVL